MPAVMKRLNDAPKPNPPGHAMPPKGVSTIGVGESCPLGVVIDDAPMTSAVGEPSHAAVRNPRIPRAAATHARFIGHLSWRARRLQQSACPVQPYVPADAGEKGPNHRGGTRLPRGSLSLTACKLGSRVHPS